ncbi:MAG TPA: small basic family protein, partial [Abditibacteriaceae bacterium]|nr:small basic family protein [Abditibacteriaceae bacterium]
MILLPLLALVLGFLIFYIPTRGLGADEAVARYTAIAVLAGLDTILGGLRAWLADQFDNLVFLTGFFANALLAAGLVGLGEQLGLETGFGDGRISVMMIAAVVVLSMRIFNNLAGLRRLIIDRWRARRAEAQLAANAALAETTAPQQASPQQA